jgi:hypothetical protein
MKVQFISFVQYLRLFLFDYIQYLDKYQGSMIYIYHEVSLFFINSLLHLLMSFNFFRDPYRIKLSSSVFQNLSQFLTSGRAYFFFYFLHQFIIFKILIRVLGCLFKLLLLAFILSKRDVNLYLQGSL